MTNREHRLAVGRRIQEIRGSRDQRTFAEAVESVQQTISKYERGEIPRSWLFLARLRREEGVDLNRLLSGQPQSEEAEQEGDGRRGNGHERGEERPAAEGGGNGRERLEQADQAEAERFEPARH